MIRAIDPAIPEQGGYVVPLPRATDAVGKSLRHIYAVPPANADFLAEMLRRLDAIA